ncbi:MAG: hypothetical protein LBE27_00320 [Deltaproteobacteria bacterium]|nr:hypothetical protein [Deltaproteobacteria bacterium]
MCCHLHRAARHVHNLPSLTPGPIRLAGPGEESKDEGDEVKQEDGGTASYEPHYVFQDAHGSL